MDDLEEKILKDTELKPRIWWKYIDDIFFIWEHREDSLKQFIETLNACHPTIKFTAEWPKEKPNFLDVSITLRNRQLETDLHIKLTLISFLTQHIFTLTIVRKVYPTVRL